VNNKLKENRKTRIRTEETKYANEYDKKIDKKDDCHVQYCEGDCNHNMSRCVITKKMGMASG